MRWLWGGRKYNFELEGPKYMRTFGDGAGAVILGRSNLPGIIAGDISSSGSFAISFELLAPQKMGFLGNWFAKCGTEFSEDSGILIESGVKLLDAYNMDVESIDWLIPHQANMRIINKVGKA